VNYGELKTFVLADAHREDLTGEVAGFIRRAEGMIRRDLVGYELEATLDESGRIALGVYTLPATVLIVRAVYGESSGREYQLADVGAVNIKSIPDTYRAEHYAIRGNTIEFRGVPGTSEEFALHYFGHPAALAADGDENALLTDHEELYVAGAQFYLRLHTEDRELANDAFGRFVSAMEKLNDATARKVGGGAAVAGPYNLGNRPVGSGY
jgi:hypothetical protein